MLELLFLLLPVAAGYGWVMGRNSVRQAQRQSSSILSKHYFKGLNFLLSDQPDKAVDTLIKMIDVNTANVETHISMGNFFRHRGELDRAIKIHQNLVGKEGIESKQKEDALYELGRDYALAGFLERAENTFIQLLGSEKHFLAAQQQLFGIYQTTKEWDRAIELAENMMENHGDSDELCQRIAHFYCEHAQVYLKLNDSQQAEKDLQKAIMSDEHTVRPWLMLAEMAIQKQDYSSANDYLKQVPLRDVSWFSEAVPLLEKCAEGQGSTETLRSLLDEYSGQCATAYLAKVKLIAEQESISAATEFLLEQLNGSPTMRGFHTLLGLYIRDPHAKNTEQSLMMLQKLVEEQMQQRPKYRCGGCGFSGRRIHWLCPSCKSWGLMKPIKGLDGE
ncbi:lipopolysaccharide assembly protein LapB [Paraneptunicella aestuarii]|uniref:lipopolysaccharide assembly protein LapB n=1 Tax=Paraneptunicella aestuarii TaxID=2831148 RepID=UPI001E40E5E4|nr:lipopolysaccharide assembly protein LapB [Paraneptunicella aestuarii]UAA40400.1 lipopolysaccharide assembly protein LapB [Paraneptunicella aestuarii]